MTSARSIVTAVLSVLLLTRISAAAYERTGATDIALTFALDGITGEQWRADDLQITLSLPHVGAGQVRLQLGELVLASGERRFSDLDMRCGNLTLEGSSWQCIAGRLSASTSPFGVLHEVPWTGRWDDRAGASVRLEKFPLAGGELALNLVRQSGSWMAQTELRGVRLERLLSLFPELDAWRAWSVRGRLTGSIEVRGSGGDLQDLLARGKLDLLEFASADGLQAAEGVALDWQVGVGRQDAGWDVDIGLASDRGQVYFDPVFIDAGANALKFEGSARWAPDTGALDVDRWVLVQADTMEADGRLRLSGPPFKVRSARARVRSVNLDRLYQRWLQPFLIGGVGDDLTLHGAGGAQAQWDQQGLQALELSFDNLSVQEQARRFAAEGATGAWYWQREDPVASSVLQVRAARVYRFAIGPFTLRFRALGPTLELVQPLELPALDGAIRVAAFRAERRADHVRANASVVVEALDLEALTAALGWPTFRGVLSARLPNVSYEDGVIRTNDELSFSAFDGEVRLRDLVIRDVFGVLPALEGEALLRGLDLAALTEAYSLGRIEGRLDGELLNLELLGWRPNRFDMRLHTPRGSKARRRISQRAVENLTELGTGVPGGVSAMVLKIFDQFPYDRIDIRIGLQGDTAELGGLDAPNGGYYLVRGAGLPRIDVIGRNRQVAWKDLIRRLKNIRLEGAEVK